MISDNLSNESKHKVWSKTPVTQEGNLTANCKNRRDCCCIIVKSHKALWHCCRAQWDHQGRRQRRHVLNMLKTNTVVINETYHHNITARALWAVAGAPRVLWHRSSVAQDEHSIAIWSLLGHAQIWLNISHIVLVPIRWSLWFLLITCGVHLYQLNELSKNCNDLWQKIYSTKILNSYDFMRTFSSQPYVNFNIAQTWLPLQLIWKLTI